MISALRGAGVEVSERHEPVWEGREQKWRAGVGVLPRLALAEARLLRAKHSDEDAVIVGYPGHFDLPAARRFARGRLLVFNPLVSLVDTLVSDRGRFRAGSLPARALAAIDRRALRARWQLLAQIGLALLARPMLDRFRTGAFRRSRGVQPAHGGIGAECARRGRTSAR